MRIAICDDDSFELARISALLDAYRQEREACLCYQSYPSAAQLLETMKSAQFDMLFLDILMPGLTGIQAAHEVRGFDQEVRIIFLTSSPDFALESYAVRAWDYMLKPVSKKKLFAVLDAALAAQCKSLDGLSIKTQGSMAHILFAKLAFVEVMNKHLYFHLSDGSVRELSASLCAYESELLSRPEFLKVHRAFIVNLWQMEERKANCFVSYSGNMIPISRLLYSEVRRAYMAHLFMENAAK